MSRTIRRMKEKKRLKSGQSNFVQDYVSKRELPSDVTAWCGGKQVVHTGKEYDKAYHAFHSDTKRNYGWSNDGYTRKISIDSWRVENKAEIIRFMKNNDYEVIMHEPRCLFWDR